MEEKKWYFSLKFKGKNPYQKNGASKKFAEKIVNIGEASDCDVRYESGEYKPEYYASILQNEDGQSWHIVKRSSHIDIYIAGKGNIGYAHTLNDGDIIRFEGQEMAIQFNIHHDNKYDVKEDKNKTWQWAVLVGSCLLAILALFFNYNKETDICEKDVEKLEESIFLVKVDSVQLLLKTQQREELLAPTKILTNDAPTGTSFLTTDGILVTARHCVEYWLGINVSLTTKVDSLKMDDITRWAIEAETYNEMHEEEEGRMLLRSFFSVYNFMGDLKYSFASTDSNVHINTEHDGVFQLADFNQNRYLRSIRPYFKNKEMALGDILWISGLEEGKIELASRGHVNSLKKGTKLMVCGYPMTGLNDRQVTFTQGTIIRQVAIEQENLFIESNINHGFSGGPIIKKTKNGVVAVGVVSRVDSISSGLYKWAVPITEIKTEKGGEE